MPNITSRFPAISEAEVLAARPAKSQVDPRRPYAFLCERERAADGMVEDVATIFLTNRECPWRCLMCDLWRNTTDETVTPGVIAEQIDYALARLPPARHVKLYNSGNFFDAKAIPPGDHAAIAERVRSFRTVIVENHPKLCGEACTRFRDLMGTRLEIAMGLETVHLDVLPRLNKDMTLDDFARAVELLLRRGISVRAFVLLRPPFLGEAEGVEWAVKSVEFACSLGVGCISIIPARGGNGIMDRLERAGHYAPPKLRSLEQSLASGLEIARLHSSAPRVFVDLWGAETFCECRECGPARIARLAEMNLTQQVLPGVACNSCNLP
ncbi:MAG TPA: radical SAM protein [Pirellulales bacterium]|nr:radical SAM protein [Pirellulales bacterium]